MIKKKPQIKKVMFNNSERELCSVCGFPDGFCRHTIEEELRDRCPATPLTQEHIWQLVRSHAICETEKTNLWNNLSKENKELKDDNANLMQENQELRSFKKHMEEILLRTVKDNIKYK